MSTTKRRGVVIDRPDLTILDTREMEWEEFAGLKGARIKVLSRDEEGEPSVFLVWLPPGRLISDLPHRHYHRTIREYGFTLAGELPHWEYENAEQREGDLVVFQEGYYMDRAPGSLHGLEPGPTSPIGCVVLMWRTGRGTWVDEPAFGEETVEVPYP